MARIVNNEFEDKLVDYTIVDCRYPYEFEGGHIKVGLYKLKLVNRSLNSLFSIS